MEFTLKCTGRQGSWRARTFGLRLKWTPLPSPQVQADLGLQRGLQPTCIPTCSPTSWKRKWGSRCTWVREGGWSRSPFPGKNNSVYILSKRLRLAQSKTPSRPRMTFPDLACGPLRSCVDQGRGTAPGWRPLLRLPRMWSALCSRSPGFSRGLRFSQLAPLCGASPPDPCSGARARDAAWPIRGSHSRSPGPGWRMLGGPGQVLWAAEGGPVRKVEAVTQDSQPRAETVQAPKGTVPAPGGSHALT